MIEIPKIETGKKKYQKPEVKKLPKFQKKDPFEDFLDNIDQNDERRSPTQEEKEKMDEKLIKLGQLFEGSEVRWHLDGALNISLMKGEYIGIHKDVDISVEQNDLGKLDKQMIKNGYGVFLSHHLDKNNLALQNLERVSPAEAAKRSEHITIAAVDKDGKIIGDAALNFIDIHLIKRNEQGKPIGYGNVVLPDSWLEPKEILFKGKKINISNPAKVIYFKLHQSRAYDQTDSLTLIETGKITKEEFAEIEQVINKESSARLEMVDKILENIASKLKEEMDAQQIYDVFLQVPAVAEKAEEVKDALMQVCQEISQNSDKSLNKIKDIFFKTFKIKEGNDEILSKFKELALKQREMQKIKSIRENL